MRYDIEGFVERVENKQHEIFRPILSLSLGRLSCTPKIAAALGSALTAWSALV